MATHVVGGNSQEAPEYTQQQEAAAEIIQILHTKFTNDAKLYWCNINNALRNIVSIPDHFNYLDDLIAQFEKAEKYQSLADAIERQYMIPADET